MQCEFAQHFKTGPTVGESNTWIPQKTSLRNHWVLLAPCLNEKLDAVTTILCRGNAYKEIAHIVSASLYLIDAGLCHPVDNLD
jgi:hypothetical protein